MLDQAGAQRGDVLAAEPRLDRLGVVAERGARLSSSRCPSGVRRIRNERPSSGFGTRSAWPRRSRRLTRKIIVESGMIEPSASPVGVHGPSAPIIT